MGLNNMFKMNEQHGNLDPAPYIAEGAEDDTGMKVGALAISNHADCSDLEAVGQDEQLLHIILQVKVPTVDCFHNLCDNTCRCADGQDGVAAKGMHVVSLA